MYFNGLWLNRLAFIGARSQLHLRWMNISSKIFHFYPAGAPKNTDFLTEVSEDLSHMGT